MKFCIQLASLVLGFIGNVTNRDPLDSLVTLNKQPEKIESRVKWSTTKLILTTGDITKQPIDAIVNPANVYLMNKGGVAYAIDRAAGPLLQEYIDTLPNNNGKYLKVGTALTTGAFDLSQEGIQYIIHGVGPDTRSTWQNTQREKLLASTYLSILEEANKNEAITSVAFPSISTGIFGYDINQAAPVALTQVIKWIKSHPLRFKEVRFVLWPDNFNIYKNILNK